MNDTSLSSFRESDLSVAHGRTRDVPSGGLLDEPVHLRFARIARERPAAPAARFGDRTLSYGELDARAVRLARHLRARGVTRETMVAVCLAPSLDLLIAMLAIWKAGGVYVPLDPSHPQKLVAGILEEVLPPLVLTDARSSVALPAGARCLFLDRPLPPDVALAELPEQRVRPGQSCYVLYTSGTTGRPKGVVASHENLTHYLGVAGRRFGFRADDVFCSLARYTFSISFFELLCPLTLGASVLLLARDEVLDPGRLAQAIGQISVLHAGPSLLSSLLRHLRGQGGAACRFPRVRHASSGGDLVPAQLLEQMKHVFPAAALFVIYGCTEISCMGSAFEVPRETPCTRTLVGTPFEDVTLRVVGEDGALVPVGEVGEVCFAGRGVARRYLARPALTSEKFVCFDGQRFYRTGDLGRMHPDGNLELLGRADFQVQVRGIRIELVGIEHTVCALGLAAQCAVVAVARGEHDVRLAAFVVGPRRLALSELRARLGRELPDSMLPQALYVLESLPLTTNGKLDRRRLVELASAAAEPLRAGRTPITCPTEREIAAAFASVLGVPEVSHEDDFFALGGHSLTAVLLLSELQNRLGLSLSPTLLFERTSVRAIAEAVREGSDAAQKPVLLSDSTEAPALFMLLGVHLYRELARELAGQYSVYGVYAARELALFDGSEAPSIPELAREYVAIIRRQQPVGPYRIGGMSFGGIVAYEVAQQLEDAGEEVASLVLLDAVLPESGLGKLRRLAGLPGRVLREELSARFRSRLAGARDEQTTTFLKHTDDAALRALDERRQAAYRAAALRYVRAARPFHGPTTLIVAGERLARQRLEDPSCGFARLVPSLAVHRIEADHLGLLESPRVDEVSAILVRCLAPGERAAAVAV